MTHAEISTRESRESWETAHDLGQGGLKNSEVVRCFADALSVAAAASKPRRPAKRGTTWPMSPGAAATAAPKRRRWRRTPLSSRDDSWAV